MYCRSPVAKFLLEGGQCESWLLGNSIISVTTSGGAQVGRSGLCEKCLSIARAVTGRGSSRPDDAVSMAALRRRHKSDAVRTCRSEDGSVALLKPLVTHSQDDIGLHRHAVACAASGPAPANSSSDDVELMRLDAKKKAMDDVLISTSFYRPFFLKSFFSGEFYMSNILITVRLWLNWHSIELCRLKFFDNLLTVSLESFYNK